LLNQKLQLQLHSAYKENLQKNGGSNLSRIPANHFFGLGKDRTINLTGAYVFLSSPALDYTNERIFTVDGAWIDTIKIKYYNESKI
jgi:hypothetical protein